MCMWGRQEDSASAVSAQAYAGQSSCEPTTEGTRASISTALVCTVPALREFRLCCGADRRLTREHSRLCGYRGLAKEMKPSACLSPTLLITINLRPYWQFKICLGSNLMLIFRFMKEVIRWMLVPM